MSSAFTKSKLKASRDAIQKKEWQDAVDAANDVLEHESDNYNAIVFSALALLNLDRFQESEAAYQKAVHLQPNQLLAYQGLNKFYTQRKQYQQLAHILLQEADVHLQADDAVKCAECIQRLIQLQREEGGKRLTAQALSYLLPSSKYYPLLATLPQPEPTGTRSTTFDVEMAIHMHPLKLVSEIATLHEELEQKDIDQEVERQRMRLGGAGKSKDTLRNEAGITIWQQSPLPSLYESIMNHRDASDEERRDAEGKLLRYLHRLLLALPAEPSASHLSAPRGTAAEAEQPLEPKHSTQTNTRTQTRDRIIEMARGMVIVGVPDELAWAIHLEWHNVTRLTQYSHQTLRQFVSLFPRSGRAYSCRALLLALHDQQYLVELQEEKKARDVDHGDDDLEPIDLAVRGLQEAPDSSLAQCIAARLYLLERDFLSSYETALAATSRVEAIQSTTGVTLSGPLRDLKSIQGISLAKSGAGTTQTRSKAIRLLDAALESQADNDVVDIEAVMARAGLDTESDRWSEANQLYHSVLPHSSSQSADDALLSLHKDPAVEARAELAWCTVMLGKYAEGAEELRHVSETLDADATKDESQQMFQDEDRARTWWRLGECTIRQVQANEPEVQVDAAFTCYITALKRYPSFAPAFTSLGTYYESYAPTSDLARSSKCFQKAFELDSRQFHAAYKLADHYATQREWDLVSLIAKRVIEGEGGSQALNPDAGTLAAQQRYKPQNAWAWKAIGSVRLEKGDAEAAITPLQIALRSTPDDAVVWQRLGEAYSKTARFTAALKAFAQAQSLDSDNWQTVYFTAEVRRNLGQHEEAIGLLQGILAKYPDALIGVQVALGETYLQKSQQEFHTGYVVRAEQSIRMALHHALEVIQQDSQLRSSWKIITDALFALGRFGSLSSAEEIHDENLFPLVEFVDGVYPSIDSDLPAVDVVTRSSVAEQFAASQEKPMRHALAALALCVYLSKLRVILCASDSHAVPSAWADLAVSLSRYADLCKLAGDSAMDGEGASSLTKQAISCIKAALNHEPANASFWMVLGNLTFTSSVHISQHAYVRAIESNASSNVQDATPWANLGVLYLHHGDVELANDAFTQARTIDPDHAAAWTGQALLSVRQGRETEAIATFETAMDLSQGSLLEADYGYAQGVFSRPSSSSKLQSADASASSSAALSALKAYLSHHPSNATVLHLSALLCERLGMFTEARANLETAKALLEEEYDRTESPVVAERFGLVMCDFGRVLFSSSAEQQHKEILNEAVENIETGLGLLQADEEEGHEEDNDEATATRLSPADTTKAIVCAQLTLGRIHQALGDDDEAAQAVRVAVEELEAPHE